MNYFVRKIETKRIKNSINKKISYGEMKLSIFSHDIFNSEKSQLSFWQISGDNYEELIKDLENVKVIISLMGQQLQNIGLICISESDIEEFNLTNSIDDAKTACIGEEKRHYNTSYLSLDDYYKFVEKIYELVSKDINNDYDLIPYVSSTNSTEMEKLIVEKANKGKIDFDKINPILANDLHKKFPEIFYDSVSYLEKCSDNCKYRSICKKCS